MNRPLWTSFSLFLVVGLMASSAVEPNESDVFLAGPGGVVWQDRVLPLPKEMTVTDALRLPARQIRQEIDCADPDALPLETARELLDTIALHHRGRPSLVISLLDRAAAAGRVPGALLDQLAGLPNADQAYMIHAEPGDGEAPARLILVGNTPIGMLYAARTLHQLALPPPQTFEATPLDVPLVSVMDWPDLDLRGEWGPSIVWNLDTYAQWKLNSYYPPVRMTLDENGQPVEFVVGHGNSISDLPRFLRECARRGILNTASVPHIGQNRHLLEHGGFRRAIGEDGEPRSQGFCWADPSIIDLTAIILRHITENVVMNEGGARYVSVGLTESGPITCHCPDCDGEVGYVSEARGVLEAWKRMRPDFPDMEVKITLSQGTRFANANERLVELCREYGAVISFYDGHITYASADYTPIILPELEAFARDGGRLAVVPTLVAHFGAPLPCSIPQFVRFRIQEFVDKQLSEICAFTEADWRSYPVNIAALGEYAWNAHGRSPHAFARAFAVHQDMGCPDRFARWVDAAGMAAWELASTAFFTRLLHQGRTASPRIEDAARFAAALAAAEIAMELAIESRNEVMLFESEATLAGLRAVAMLPDIDAALRDAGERDRQTALLGQLDEYAHQLHDSLYRWHEHAGARIVREIPRRGPWYGLSPSAAGTMGLGHRLALSAPSLIFLGDSLVEQAMVLHGIEDPRGDYVPVEVGGWTPADFDEQGRLQIDMDWTRVVPEAGGRYMLAIELLEGGPVRLNEAWDIESVVVREVVDPVTGRVRPFGHAHDPWLRLDLNLARRRPREQTRFDIPMRRPGEQLRTRVEFHQVDEPSTGVITLRRLRYRD